MHAGAERLGAVRRHHRRALAVSFAAALALAAAGCSNTSDAGSSANSSSVPVVTAEQVITSCVQNYFQNGILPKAAAETNCTDCTVDRLGKIGIRPSGGESDIDMLTGDRLSNSVIQMLQNNCNESDANEQ